MPAALFIFSTLKNKSHNYLIAAVMIIFGHYFIIVVSAFGQK